MKITLIPGITGTCRHLLHCTGGGYSSGKEERSQAALPIPLFKHYTNISPKIHYFYFLNNLINESNLNSRHNPNLTTPTGGGYSFGKEERSQSSNAQIFHPRSIVFCLFLNLPNS